MQKAWRADEAAMAYFESAQAHMNGFRWGINVTLAVDAYRRWLRDAHRHHSTIQLKELKERMDTDWAERTEDSEGPSIVDKTYDTAVRRLAQRWVYDCNWNRRNTGEIQRRGAAEHALVFCKHCQKKDKDKGLDGYEEGMLHAYRENRKNFQGSRRAAVEDAMKGAKRAASRAKYDITRNFDIRGLQGEVTSMANVTAAIDRLEKEISDEARYQRVIAKYIKGEGDEENLKECSIAEQETYKQIRADTMGAKTEQQHDAIQQAAKCEYRWKRVTTRHWDNTRLTALQDEQEALKIVKQNIQHMAKGGDSCTCTI